MPPPSQQQQSGDNSLGPLWIVIGLFLVGWLLWACFHTQIVACILWIKAWEARLVAWLLPSVSALADQINYSYVHAAQVDFSQLLAMSRSIGEYLRYPVGLILFFLAIAIYVGHINLQFKKVYSMKSLTQAEKKTWPQISPVVKLNLVAQDIDQGPWAMALTPMQFAKKHGLLQEEKTIISSMTMSARVGNQVTVQIRREAAYQVFAMQLGSYWQGVEQLTPATKALFVIFAARINRDKEGAQALLLQIAEATDAGKADFSHADSLWQKHKNNQQVHRITQSHAYVLTIMASLLTCARKDGVLASADFLWLKPVNRPLWFMLNSVGRQAVVSEVAGPFAHWNVECVMGRRLRVPMVEQAVNGLSAAIKETLYIADLED